MFQRGLEFLIFSQFLMSLSAVSFIHLNSKLFKANIPSPLYIIAFFGVMFVYLADARLGLMKEDPINKPYRTEFFTKYLRQIEAVIVISILLCLLFFFKMKWDHRLAFYILTMGIFGLLYLFRFQKFSFKNISYLKTIWITLAWLIGAIGLCFIYSDSFLSLKLTIPIVTIQFIWLFLDTMALDLRDARGDRTAGIKTLAQKFSTEHLQKFLFLVSGGIFIFTFWLDHELRNTFFTYNSLTLVGAAQLAGLFTASKVEKNGSLHSLFIMLWRFF